MRSLAAVRTMRPSSGAQFNPAFALELEHHGTGVSHTTAVLGEGVADFRHSTVFIIGGNLNNNPDAAGAVAFVNFFNQGSGGFVGDASDGALNVDLWRQPRLFGVW